MNREIEDSKKYLYEMELQIKKEVEEVDRKCLAFTGLVMEVKNGNKLE